MKLFTAVIAAAHAQLLDETTKVENYNVARSGDFENYRFTAVPDGFEGSFQNFNTTQVLEENKDDEIYREFEVLYSYVDSNLGRKEYSEEQKSMIRKVNFLNRFYLFLAYNIFYLFIMVTYELDNIIWSLSLKSLIISYELTEI